LFARPAAQRWFRCGRQSAATPIQGPLDSEGAFNSNCNRPGIAPKRPFALVYAA
jgi:hypothetical protein